MKIIKFTIYCTFIAVILGCKNEKPTATIAQSQIEESTDEDIKVIPIKHGTLVLETLKEVIYVDPTGGPKAFKGQKKPSLVLITDIHGDHLNVSTLESLDLSNATIIGPKVVTDKIPSTVCETTVTISNGDSYNFRNLTIEAIPMYNLREEALKFHEKGRGNGYLINTQNKRIYISGDTEDIPEMRQLTSIDIAFVCMNLPYTMTVESAASAVLDFKPKMVYPYHYRGTEGLSDVDKFKSIIASKNDKIEVKLMDWYSN